MTPDEFCGKWGPNLPQTAIYASWTADLAALLETARAEERARCVAVVKRERLEDPQTEEDAAYDRAIRDAVAALESLKREEERKDHNVQDRKYHPDSSGFTAD